MRPVDQHAPATELAARLVELRANARAIATAYRVPLQERERLLRLNAADMAAATLRFRAMTDPALLVPAANRKTHGGRYRAW